MTDDIKWNVIERYLSGEALPLEIEAIEHQAGHDAGFARTLQSARLVWDRSVMGSRPVDADEAWRALHGRMHAAHGARVSHPMIPASARGRVVGAAAALLALVAGLGVVLRNTTKHTPAAATIATVDRTYTTRRAERAEFRLTDGSRVILGPGSSLRIPAAYGQATRELFLDGEGYFEVRHDAARPMRVYTARSVTEDLGTRFTIAAHRDASVDVVVVAEGRVSLRTADSATAAAPTVLRAHDLGRVSSVGVAAMRHISPERYMSWVDGIRRFEDLPLGDVITTLERQYDVTIHLDDPALRDRHITAAFADGQVDARLQGLAFLLNVKYARHGRDVTYTSR